MTSDNLNVVSHHPATQPTEDPFLLGSTSGQRSAELVTALRAIVEESPEDMALSTYAGRTFAQLLIRISGSQSLANVTSNRHTSMTTLVERILNTRPQGTTVIELASGFSPRAWRLAHRYPDHFFIEIDQENVVAEKKNRLKKLNGAGFPPNLTWKTADLSITPLSELVDGTKVDIITCEGLLPYFSPSEITRLARTIYDSMVVGGVMISDMINHTGWEHVQATAGLAERILTTQIGKFSGYATSKDEVQAMFTSAGYARIEVFELIELVEMFNLPTPVTNTSYLQVAHK